MNLNLDIVELARYCVRALQEAKTPYPVPPEALPGFLAESLATEIELCGGYGIASRATFARN